jgi:hypothetical protein
MSNFMDKAKDVAGDLAHKGKDLADKAGEHIPDSVKDKASDFGEKAGELIEKAKEKLGLGHDESKAAVETASATDAPLVPDAAAEPAATEPATPGPDASATD